MNSIFTFFSIVISIILIILIFFQNVNNKKSNLDLTNINNLFNFNNLYDPLTKIIFIFSILFLTVNLIISLIS